jgi:hypothetical protein
MYLTYYVHVVGIKRSEVKIKVLCIFSSNELSSDEFLQQAVLHSLAKRPYSATDTTCSYYSATDTTCSYYSATDTTCSYYSATDTTCSYYLRNPRSIDIFTSLRAE